jgi:2'-5' RNA ligase superfamily
MGFDPNGAGRLDSFALVTYIPDPLGDFLDRLRLELIPGCAPHAHVTLLPPRPLRASQHDAWEQVCDAAQHVPGFDLEAGRLSVFPVTNVVYLEIGLGRETLVYLHNQLNKTAFAYDEPFSYHPHITLAQEIPVDLVTDVTELARRRWAEYRQTRRFPVRTLTFVQNTSCDGWLDLAGCALQTPVSTPTGS